MALRTIRVQGDPVLEKVCKPVKEMTPKIGELIEDMLDTMYEANGVGLAAPQVGILKRIVVIDVGEGPIVMINPVILETSGEQTGDEGCLSIPGKAGQVTRPNYVKGQLWNENHGSPCLILINPQLNIIPHYSSFSHTVFAIFHIFFRRDRFDKAPRIAYN